LKLMDYASLIISSKPKAIIQASEDEFAGRAEITEAVARMAPPNRLFIVEGASHLFPGHLDQLERAAGSAIAYLRGLPGGVAG
jgi:alpha/beta superfamily hydrolase